MIPFSNWSDRPLLDVYSGATIALSTRKLRTGYTGNCMRVRRSSDNAEQDIGFVGTQLDTASLLSFVGGTGNYGYVKIWYDQSGNGYDVSQTTVGNQPLIVNNGIVTAKNFIPTLNFTIGTRFLTRAAIPALSSGNDLSYFNVSLAIATETIGVVWDTNNTAGGGGLNARIVTYCDSRTATNRNMVIVNTSGTAFNYDLSSPMVSTDLRVTSGVVIGSGTKTASVWNNSTAGTSAGWNGNYTNNCFEVGQQLGGSLPLDGKIGEIIIYPSDKSSVRQPIENNIKRYFGIA